MDEMPKRVEFAYTADDYAEFTQAINRYLARKSTSRRKLWAVFFVTCLIGGPLIILADYSSHSAAMLGGLVGGIGFWYCYGFLYRIFQIRFGVRKQFEGEQILHGNRTMEFSESGYETRGPRYYSALSWESFNGLIESENLFILVQPPGLYVMIPKRAFGPDQAGQFRDFIAEKLSVQEER